MNTKAIGNIGEAYALAKFVELGIPIYQQFGDNEYADYIILLNNMPLKVQVKSSMTFDGDKIVFDLVTSTLINGKNKKHIYSVSEIDLFVCFDVINNKIFAVKNNGNMKTITIRYSDPKNNQKNNIKYYNDYILTLDLLKSMF